jgi:hypothetical protein
VGDSTIIIHHIRCQSSPQYIHQGKFIHRVQGLVKSYESIEFFHVLRSYNVLAFLNENEAVSVEVGIVCINGGGPILSLLQ